MNDTDHSAERSSSLAAPRPAMSSQDRAVLAVLLASAGRVVSRTELARRAGLADRSERRSDAILVHLRRSLGPDAIRTVRSRGWILLPTATDQAKALLDA